MKITYTLNPDELDALRSAVRNQAQALIVPAWIPRLVAYALFPAFAALFYFVTGSGWMAAALWWLSLLLLCSANWLLQKVSAHCHRKYRWRHPEALTHEITIEDGRLLIDHDQVHSSYPLENVEVAREDETLWVRLGHRGVVGIPLSSFNSLDERQAFEAMLGGRPGSTPESSGGGSPRG